MSAGEIALIASLSGVIYIVGVTVSALIAAKCFKPDDREDHVMVGYFATIWPVFAVLAIVVAILWFPLLGIGSLGKRLAELIS